MKRLALLTALFLPILFVAAMIGCSDDKSTDSQLVAGDTSSADFQFVSGYLGDEYAQSVKDAIDLTFMLWDSIPDAPTTSRHFGDRLAAQDDNFVFSTWNYTYDHTSGWSVFTFEGTVKNPSDTITITGVDSVQFLVGDTPVQHPDSTVTALHIRPHFSMVSTVTGSNLSSDQSLSLTNLSTMPTAPITVNGSSLEEASLVFGNCTFGLSNHLTITNVVIVFASDDCPSSGHMNLGSTLDLSCTGDGGSLDSLNINGAWNLAVSWNGTVETLVYSNNTTQWVVSDSCGSGPAAASRAWMLPGEK